MHIHPGAGLTVSQVCFQLVDTSVAKIKLTTWKPLLETNSFGNTDIASPFLLYDLITPPVLKLIGSCQQQPLQMTFVKAPDVWWMQPNTGSKREIQASRLLWHHVWSCLNTCHAVFGFTPVAFEVRRAVLSKFTAPSKGPQQQQWEEALFRDWPAVVNMLSPFTVGCCWVKRW